MSKIHSYYITNGKSELPNYSKDRTAEELCAILNDAYLCEEEDINEYNEEEIAKFVSGPFTDDNNGQVPSQDLEILNLLDLNLMFRDESNNSTDKELDSEELNNFIQELDNEDDFDPDLLVQNFNN